MKKASSKAELREKKTDRKSFLKVVRAPIYVVLDSLKSAYNVGSIFRLADALLVTKIYLCGQTIIPPNYKLKTTSRGTERWVPWEYRKSAVETVRKLKEAGVFILCAELTEDSIDYKKMLPSFPVCLVLGREYDGVSPEVLDLADAVVSLPIYGMTNSLNVASTASVLLYELSQMAKHQRDP
ncbi:RNA methyltransferase [Candidatus Peregrinibacteria bacterium]|nr:RNA methyltransferase [Candidatus Peregrinibacteria bacterium]